jgi:hypothetical protein
VSSLLTITFFRFPASIFLPVSPRLRVNLFPHLPVSPFHFFSSCNLPVTSFVI